MLGTVRPDYGHDRGLERAGARPSAQDGPQPSRPIDISVAVIVERDDNGEQLIRELQRLRCAVRHIWPMPPQLPLQHDAVFCMLTPDLPQRMPWVPGEPASAVILVDTGAAPLNVKLMRNCAAHGLVHFPITPRSVQSSLLLAREHFLYERRLRGRIEKLDENLRTMRAVERAKALIMRMKNLPEEEAYNVLRKQAMQRQVAIGVVANALIDSHELLG